MVSETIRKIIEWKKLEVQIREFLREYLRGKGFSDVKLIKTPLGEKIIIYCARPSLIIGRGGTGVTKLTLILKKEFNLENPQVEVRPVENPYLDANIMAEWVALRLERYGIQRFKAIGYRALELIMGAGAKGAEVIISGKVPGQRAKTWRFAYPWSYMKKAGEIWKKHVRKGLAIAYTPPGVVGVKVLIMPPIPLPDEIKIKEPTEIKIEELEQIDPEIAMKFKEVLEKTT